MPELKFDSLEIGDEVAVLENPALTRTTLALFAGASGDHNPIHIDIDFAKKNGMDDVFAHGMLSMAYLGRLLTSWVPQTAIRKYSVRFISIANLHDRITCKGTVAEKYEEGGKHFIKLDLIAVNQDGDIKLKGEAVVSLQ